MDQYMLPCLNKKLFGVECLGCGLQRSAFLLIKGDFAAAFALYPAIYPLAILLTFIGINFFLPVKYYAKIIWTLGILTGVTMVISYYLKHF